jgi:hypothetical protein
MPMHPEHVQAYRDGLVPHAARGRHYYAGRSHLERLWERSGAEERERATRAKNGGGHQAVFSRRNSESAPISYSDASASDGKAFEVFIAFCAFILKALCCTFVVLVVWLARDSFFVLLIGSLAVAAVHFVLLVLEDESHPIVHWLIWPVIVICYGSVMVCGFALMMMEQQGYIQRGTLTDPIWDMIQACFA